MSNEYFYVRGRGGSGFSEVRREFGKRSVIGVWGRNV